MSIDNQKTAAASSGSPVQSHYQTDEESDPMAKASYEEVVANGMLFMETLEELHKSLGTKFMVPTIGGKPLDLHCLFVEVTRRGGLQKVIGGRKWKEVASAFTFPSTLTNATFVLRKHYIALLQVYEQLYFFRKGDSKHSSNDARASGASDSCGAAISRMLRSTTDPQIHEHCSLSVGSMVKGNINGKFENGYIVTSDFGFEILSGVLFHVPSRQPPDPDNSPLPSKRRGQKRSRKETGTPNLKSDMGKLSMKEETGPSTLESDMGKCSPKETDLSNLKLDTDGYNVFFAEHYSELRHLYHGKEKVIVKLINTLWNNLTESDKEVYRKMNKERRETGM